MTDEKSIAVGIDPGKEIALAYRDLAGEWRTFFHDFKASKAGERPLDDTTLYGSVIPAWVMGLTASAIKEAEWDQARVHVLVEDWVWFKGNSNTNTAFMNRLIGSLVLALLSQGVVVHQPIRSVSWKSKLGLRTLTRNLKGKKKEDIERKTLCSLLKVPFQIYGANSHVLDAMAISQVLETQLKYREQVALIDQRTDRLVEAQGKSSFP